MSLLEKDRFKNPQKAQERWERGGEGGMGCFGAWFRVFWAIRSAESENELKILKTATTAQTLVVCCRGRIGGWQGRWIGWIFGVFTVAHVGKCRWT